MNRNDKNKKFTPLNINNVFKGKPTEIQNKTSFRVGGMQNIGKVSSMRRVPAPKWVPSIKAESGGSENRSIINQTSSGWVSSTVQEGNDQNSLNTQLLICKDKNQWISKAPSNKPFFLMGQEFPSLPSDSLQEESIDANKDNKSKETDSVKSKLDELRNRDNTISASTLNRIDALSISKSSKGDIAATGWAAEDEEPNFDEKIIFSDEESLNDVQNWHSDPEVVNSKSENMSSSQYEHHEAQMSTGDSWFEQSQASHFSQYPQYQVQMNMSPNQFITSNAQFQQAMSGRSVGSNVADDQFAFVTEQRNARNMEYCIAIERARQKKMGAGRMYNTIGEDGVQCDNLLSRSRHTSMTSDTVDSTGMSLQPQMEMAPPGGPPLIYGHLHRPHVSPMMHPMISPPPMPFPPMMQFTQPPPPIMIPAPPVHLDQVTDPKLMEKWIEFLKLQSSTACSTDMRISDDQHTKTFMSSMDSRTIHEGNTDTRQSMVRCLNSRNTQDENKDSRLATNRGLDPRIVQEDNNRQRQVLNRGLESINLQEDIIGEGINTCLDSRNVQEDNNGHRPVTNRYLDTRNMQEDNKGQRSVPQRHIDTRIVQEDSGQNQGKNRSLESRNMQEDNNVSKKILHRQPDSRNIPDNPLDSKKSNRNKFSESKIVQQVNIRPTDSRKVPDNTMANRQTFSKVLDSKNVNDTMTGRQIDSRHTVEDAAATRKNSNRSFNTDTVQDDNSGTMKANQSVKDNFTTKQILSRTMDSRNVNEESQKPKQTYNRVVEARKLDDSCHELRNVDSRTAGNKISVQEDNVPLVSRKTSSRTVESYNDHDSSTTRQPAGKTDNWRNTQKKSQIRNTSDDHQVYAGRQTPQSSQEFVHTVDRKIEYDTERRADTTDIQKDKIHKNKSSYPPEEVAKGENNKRIHQNKYGSYKEYRPSKPSYKGEYNTGVDKEYDQAYNSQYRDTADGNMYDDYHGYHQHYDKNSYDYRMNASYQYYDDSFAQESNEYNYRSNSLKYKSSKQKDVIKPSGSQTDCTQSDRSNNYPKKKSGSENQENLFVEKETFEGERKNSNDQPKVTKQSTNSYGNKRYPKDRTAETKPEYSMGFAVNPNDSRRNYYSSNYNRRAHNSDYSYSNYPSNAGSNNQYNEYSDEFYASDKYYSESKYPPNKSRTDSKYPPDNKYQQDKYYSDNKYSQGNYYSEGNYQSDRYYSDNKYPSGKHNTDTYPQEKHSQQYKQDSTFVSMKNVKKPAKVEQWRRASDSQSKDDNCQVKTNRGNRKSDKRQLSMSRDNCNDNDHDEWETASEGVSDRVNGTQREGYQQMVRHRQGGKHTTNFDSTSVNQATNNDDQKTTEYKYESTNSCHGSWPTYPDEDGSDGGSGSAGGAHVSSVTPQNVSSQAKSVESSQTQSSDNNCNSNSNKTSTAANVPTSNHQPIITDIIYPSSVINVDKLPQVTEDEELLYDNVEEFQEVLSKATKKNRRLEEQRKVKEELEQKRLEALKLKNRNDSKNVRKPTIRKEQSGPVRADKVVNGRKVDNKASIGGGRDSINTVHKYECNNVSMPIGSWDNSLADDINAGANTAPKPIGTPSSTSSPWNIKLRPSPKQIQSTEVNSIDSRDFPKISKDNENLQSDKAESNCSKIMYSPSSRDSESKYNLMFDKTNEDKKVKESVELKSVDIPDTINFDYNDTKTDRENSKNCGIVLERVLQETSQQSFNDKIHSVKNIWDNQPLSSGILQSDNNRTLTIETSNTSVANEIDTTNDGPDTLITRNCDTNLLTPTLSITNVCKVKPQLQNDCIKKDTHKSSQASNPFILGNVPVTYMAPSHQGNLLPYTQRFAPEYYQDHVQANDALASLLSGTQAPMHINYNVPSQHQLIDSSTALIRHNPAEQMMSNKINFISQQSFYPQAPVTPKLFSNAGSQMPINMDISSPHGSLPLQQFLMSRQNSLTSMMQPSGMSIPFIPGGQHHVQAHTPLYPGTPLLGPGNFSPQINPFSPGHYSPGNFPSLHHHNQQFQPNHHQMLYNHQQQHQHPHQQLLQSQISHDRVINSGQSGFFNSIMGPSDISNNAGLPDFNGQSKHLTHNNIMHGMNGSAIMLPHNLNILMKSHNFGSTSQYNTFQAPIQSNHVNVRNTYENHSNIKLATELESYRSPDTNAIDRQTYCSSHYSGLPKMQDDLYINQHNYDNSGGVNNDNWISSNCRQTNSNNFLQSFDVQSNRTSNQLFPFLDLHLPSHDSKYQHLSVTSMSDNHPSFSVSANNNSLSQSSTHRDKIQSHQIHRADQALITQTNSSYDNVNGEYSIDVNEGTNVACDSTVTSENDIIHTEKSFSKKNAKHRSVFSNNFYDGNVHSSVQSCERNNSEIDNSIDNNKQYIPSRHNMFNNQYGYNDTQLSSQTAESLGKYDSTQLKKMIMKLREGPVMTLADDFDRSQMGGSSKKGMLVPRVVMPQHHKNAHQGDGIVEPGMGFYGVNSALTSPASISLSQSSSAAAAKHTVNISSNSSSSHETVGGLTSSSDSGDAHNTPLPLHASQSHCAHYMVAVDSTVAIN